MVLRATSAMTVKHSILVCLAAITWQVVPIATSLLPAIEESSGAVWKAKAGQAYWVLVEGYSFFDTRACGELALTVTTGPVAPPPPLQPTFPPAPPSYPPPPPPDACNPYLLADLPAAGVTVFNISQTTCGSANGWNCRPAPDFLYLLPSSEEGDRSITLDTCVDGVAAWDTLLYVIPVQDGTCGQCSVRGSAGLPASSWCTDTVYLLLPSLL
ncbi:hypothetical protein HaLaN_26589 [Haematococcus lacustris]|uniref:Uncharacterized protein n=1 Tax=Haematococcus lacustris TaxID=44745 RepID=A0A6A0A703_HAELA|nr:hypothetical protein HaLaN_26589 [Haematococcus lacustris]